MSRNKKILVAAVAMAAIVSSISIVAAQTARITGYSWAGAYVGANLGYQWSSVSSFSADPDGFAGGIQAGYNWQSGQFVFGAETDLQLTGSDDVFAGWKFSNPWFGTLRGRGGIALNNVLLYGTAGLAYGGLEVQNVVNGVSQSKTHAGWAVGAGMEVALTRSWTARAEYMYVDLGNRIYSLTGTNNGLEASMLRFGVNYRF